MWDVGTADYEGEMCLCWISYDYLWLLVCIPALQLSKLSNKSHNDLFICIYLNSCNNWQEHFELQNSTYEFRNDSSNSKSFKITEFSILSNIYPTLCICIGWCRVYYCVFWVFVCMRWDVTWAISNFLLLCFLRMPAASIMTGGRALLLCTNTENCIYQSVNGYENKILHFRIII